MFTAAHMPRMVTCMHIFREHADTIKLEPNTQAHIETKSEHHPRIPNMFPRADMPRMNIQHANIHRHMHTHANQHAHVRIFIRAAHARPNPHFRRMMVTLKKGKDVKSPFSSSHPCASAFHQLPAFSHASTCMQAMFPCINMSISAIAARFRGVFPHVPNVNFFPHKPLFEPFPTLNPV
jgi:hypothetical protein